MYLYNSNKIKVKYFLKGEMYITKRVLKMHKKRAFLVFVEWYSNWNILSL